MPDKNFDYRKATIAMICPCCDREISEYEVNQFRKELFPKNKMTLRFFPSKAKEMKNG